MDIVSLRRAGIVLLAATVVGCGGRGKDTSSAAAQPPGATRQAPKGKKGPAASRPPAGRRPIRPIPVAVEPARRGPIASYYTATATLEPNKQADILARVSGVIVSIQAEEGDAVREGQVLLRIQDDEYRLRLAQAEAAVDKLTTKVARLRKMFEGNLVSAEEYETTRNDLEAAEATRDLARLELSYTAVKAPFSGRITRRLVDPGQTVSNGTALFSIADLSRLLARVHVPAKEFRRIQRRQPVRLSLDSTKEDLEGRISLVSPVIDPASGTIKVTVEISRVPAGTRPGDFAEVRIVTESHPNAVLVPKIAVITDKGKQVVYVTPDSTAERRVVQVGFQDDRNAEILQGVEEGERVVVQGQRSLKPGAPVRVMPAVDFTSPGKPGVPPAPAVADTATVRGKPAAADTAAVRGKPAAQGKPAAGAGGPARKPRRRAGGS